jgi:hypothetical protein
MPEVSLFSKRRRQAVEVAWIGTATSLHTSSANRAGSSTDAQTPEFAESRFIAVLPIVVDALAWSNLFPPFEI